jgi:isoquinoline 1-oxidoreductase subunit beta
MIGPVDPNVLAKFAELHATPSQLDRRSLLKLSVGAGAGLVLGVTLPGATPATAQATAGAVAAFNPFVRITPDNKVIVVIKHLDKGQGVATGLATLVADELDADWAQVTTEFAPSDPTRYGNIEWGGKVQGTGGSSSISNSFVQYRQAGASARQMISAAAAKAWNVPTDSVRIEKGVVLANGKQAPLGEFAATAATMPVPPAPTLKDPSKFVFIGKAAPRLDSVAKTTGKAVFTQDVKLPGMLTAVVARPTRFGGAVKSVDAATAKAVKGVVDVIQIPQGVAVLATSTWAAIKGRNALKVVWDDSKAEMRGSAELLAEYKQLAGTPGKVAKKDGDAEAALKDAAKVIEAEFVFPFLAHAPMEPMNCVMQLKDGQCTVWSGSQIPTVDQGVTAAILGIKPEAVSIKTLWAGGSFGRRAVPNADYVAETAAIVKAYGKADPIKVMWTREDDVKGGYYRPMYLHKVRAGLDAAGKIVGWHHRIVGQSILAGTPFEAMLAKDGIDGTSVEGVADTPYAIPNMQVELHTTKTGVPPLWWRSVGHTHTAYVMETVIDELAAAAGKDPVAFRLALLEKHPRHAGVLKLAAEKAGWGKPLPEGVARGVAVHESFKTFVAQVAEVRMVGGKPRVLKVTAAVDCGIAVNPDNVRSQIEGGIGFGLGAVLHSKVTLTGGQVDQSNFNDYDVLRFDEMPEVEVNIVTSDADPKGVGEPGVPPIGPAVANAVAKLTGTRVRSLPMDDTKFVRT